MPITAPTAVQIIFMTQSSLGFIEYNECGITLKLPDQTQWLLRQRWGPGGKNEGDGLGDGRGLGKRLQCRRDLPERMSELVEL